MTKENFSTIWDVMVTPLIQGADCPTPSRVIASFIHYRDLYAFMQGLHVASGYDFEDEGGWRSFTTPDRCTKYHVVERNIYNGNIKFNNYALGVGEE